MFRLLVFGSGVVYSLIIYTLDEEIWYYMTPLYLIFIVWFSMVLIELLKRAFHLGSETGKSVTVTILSVICIAGILSVRPVMDFWNYHLQWWHKYAVSFNKIAEEYQNYDCIYIEKNLNNLFDGYWFEFGEYDEFKKIPAADFALNGIREEELDGRKSENGVIVYAPLEYMEGRKAEYRLLADNGIFGIYQMKEGEEK